MNIVQIYINDRPHTNITCSIGEQLTANSILFRQSTQKHPIPPFASQILPHGYNDHFHSHTPQIRRLKRRYSELDSVIIAT